MPEGGAFLDRLTPDDRQALLALARQRHHPAGSIVLFEDDPAHDVVLIDAGHVKVAVTVGDREVVLDVLGPGAVLGELGVVDGSSRSARATALTPVVVWTIPAPAFNGLLAARPPVVMAVLRDVADRLRAASQRQVEYGALDGIGRVCRRLVELMERFGQPSGTGVVIAAPLTQGDIAAWAGLSREAVVKALQSLRRTGAITTSARTITVLDVHAVRARAALDH